jgi:DNA (cytosine-5)-methyltransferase 1
VNVLSLFSGAGGMDRGLDAAGMDIVGMCEIDPTARSVLARHWPDTPIHDDVTTLDPEEFRGRADLVAGGSPCQDLSVAGRRGGLDGSRSGLFWHQCRIADSVAAPWVLWENVAGAFSSNRGADFAAVLWGLTGTLPDVPDGGWRTAGVVVGPKRTAVWRLLDARWFGVAQRRRRVFVVAGPRGQCRPEVLLDPEGVRGNPAPSREAGEDVAATLGGGSGSRGWAPDVDRMTFVPQHVGTITANWHKGPGNTQVEEGCCIPVAFHSTQDPISSPDVCHALGTGSATAAGLAGLAVRRLTPRECERLMGWPDDWTRYRADGTEIADSHRYRMCGNGVVAPVAEWIGRRIEEAHG